MREACKYVDEKLAVKVRFPKFKHFSLLIHLLGQSGIRIRFLRWSIDEIVTIFKIQCW